MDVSSNNGGGNNEIVRIDVPNPNDVLCGRGGNINSHRGNEQFRAFVEKRKRVYLTARFKREKRLIASSIVNEIRAMDPPGRFLARMGSLKDNNGYWYDIGNEKARDKTSQALRENAPSIRAEIETEINQQRAEMRRQEKVEKQPTPTENHRSSGPPIAGGSPVSNNGANSSSAAMYQQHLPHGHHPSHGQPSAPVPPPPTPDSYSPHHSHYLQQYYDYYYHYYGYGAPPPPPPPGYQNSGGAPSSAGINAVGPNDNVPPPTPTPPASGPHGNAPTQTPLPRPYLASQSSSNIAPMNHVPPLHSSSTITPSAMPGSKHPNRGSNTTNSAPPPARAAAVVNAQTAASMNNIQYQTHSPHPSMYNQEEDDRRLAMALQQQENVKAFEERNRRFGSDRKSSRSSAYYAPGYRPRLLNDRTPSKMDHGYDIDEPAAGSGTPTRKKRPPMSLSQYFPPHNTRNLVSPGNKNDNNYNYNNKDTSQQLIHAPAVKNNPTVLASARNSSLMPPQQDDSIDHRMALTLQDQEDGAINNRRSANSKAHSQHSAFRNAFGDVESIVSAGFTSWNRGSGNDGYNNTEHGGSSHPADMERKPVTATRHNEKQELDDLEHHHDYSGFKDDSDMMSLFGEGDTIIPPGNSTGSFNRVRNSFAVNNNTAAINADNNFNLIAINERNHQSLHQHDQQQRGYSNRDHFNDDNHNNNTNSGIQQQQDSSLLSQVATHILGSFGGGGPLSKDPNTCHTKQAATTTAASHQISSSSNNNDINYNHHHSRPKNNQVNFTEMETTELGQEVIMDVRDESNMPPPQPRGTGVQIDWASRAGCHSWIPDTIGANATAIFGQTNDEHDHQQDAVNNVNDHSLTRLSICGRSDISPFNSMDLDFSHSSYVDQRRRRNHGVANTSLLHVFDQKNCDPKPGEPQHNNHRSGLQQVPSWDQSFRSKSSFGDTSVGGNEMDDSLIRVHSRDPKKDQMFGKAGLPPPQALPSFGHDLHQRYQHLSHHHSKQNRPQTRPHSNHQHHHHRDHNQQILPSQQPPQNYHESRMDWEDH